MTAIQPLLAPAALLATWTMLIMMWMMVKRVGAFKQAGIDMAQVPKGMRYHDVEDQMPAESNWLSHNYTHLLEQPTVFYAVVAILALSGDTSTLSAGLAWAYVALRIVHSFWQILVNIVAMRALIFGLSSLCLLTLAIRAVLMTLGL